MTEELLLAQNLFDLSGERSGRQDCQRGGPDEK